MRSRVGSQLQRGRCVEGGIPDGAQRPFQSRAQRGTKAACSVRQAPPFDGNSQPALPPPHEEGEALEKSTPSATYFRVERGVDFRNFQPLQRSRRLNRTFRWQTSRRFAPVAMNKTAETAAAAIARPVRASAQFYSQATRLCRWTREESVSEPEVRPPAEPVAFIATRLLALMEQCARLH